jgi:hypothetical protein
MSLSRNKTEASRQIHWVLVDDVVGSASAVGAGRNTNPPLVRSEAPPRDQLDSADRDTTRATNDDATLCRFIVLENHRNRLEWHRLLRRLVLLAGFMLVLLPAVILLRMAGIPEDWAARIAASAIVTVTTGSAVQAVIQHRRKGGGPTS